MSTPGTPGSDSATSKSPGKPRLTEVEKKQNHIASEQKRRAAIREQFDRLAELTPGMKGQGRSEGAVLAKAVEFAKEQLEEQRKLIAEIEALGGSVDPKLKMKFPQLMYYEDVEEEEYLSGTEP
ncbi:hypothetical protein MMC30_003153 [Trapelia coarctata]|nr:hypothetical protein [Trapelia coarctata]